MPSTTAPIDASAAICALIDRRGEEFVAAGQVAEPAQRQARRRKRQGDAARERQHDHHRDRRQQEGVGEHVVGRTSAPKPPKPSRITTPATRAPQHVGAEPDGERAAASRITPIAAPKPQSCAMVICWYISTGRNWPARLPPTIAGTTYAAIVRLNTSRAPSHRARHAERQHDGAQRPGCAGAAHARRLDPFRIDARHRAGEQQHHERHVAVHADDQQPADSRSASQPAAAPSSRRP